MTVCSCVVENNNKIGELVYEKGTIIFSTCNTYVPPLRIHISFRFSSLSVPMKLTIITQLKRRALTCNEIVAINQGGGGEISTRKQLGIPDTAVNSSGPLSLPLVGPRNTDSAGHGASAKRESSERISLLRFSLSLRLRSTPFAPFAKNFRNSLTHSQ